MNLNYKVNLRFEFLRIFGLGFEKISYVADLLGLGYHFFVQNLNLYFFEVISFLIKFFFIIDDRLKFLIRQQILKFIDIRMVKGIRMTRNLPVRGQRTHSNAKQNKYYKKLNEEK